MLTSFPNYIAIIGDIKGSKKIDNRNKIQKIILRTSLECLCTALLF